MGAGEEGELEEHQREGSAEPDAANTPPTNGTTDQNGQPAVVEGNSSIDNDVLPNPDQLIASEEINGKSEKVAEMEPQEKEPEKTEVTEIIKEEVAKPEKVEPNKEVDLEQPEEPKPGKLDQEEVKVQVEENPVPDESVGDQVTRKPGFWSR